MKRVTGIGFLAALFVLASLAPATAEKQERARERGQRPGPGARFERMDTDGDGEVSRKEFMQASKERAKRMFERLDTDGDGVVTEDEFRDAGRELREERRRRGGGRGRTVEEE